MADQVHVLGGRELRRTLKRAGLDMKKLTQANREAANTVAAAAVATAPARSGRLKASVRAGATQRAGVVRAGRKGTVPYAGPIHWGWPARNIEPQPWISEAAQSTESVWITRYYEHIDEILQSVEGI